MKIIYLDGSSWTSVLDFYGAILPELGAPKGHGPNHNAIVESMIWGGINKLEPPYKVQIFHTKDCPESVLYELRLISNWFAESLVEFRERRGRDAEVSFDILS